MALGYQVGAKPQLTRAKREAFLVLFILISFKLISITPTFNGYFNWTGEFHGFFYFRIY